jgi:hypothetical protein
MPDKYYEVVESARALAETFDMKDGFVFPYTLIGELKGSKAKKSVLNRVWKVVGQHFKGQEKREQRLQAMSFLFGRKIASFDSLYVSEAYALSQLDNLPELHDLLEDFAHDAD